MFNYFVFLLKTNQRHNGVMIKPYALQLYPSWNMRNTINSQKRNRNIKPKTLNCSFQEGSVGKQNISKKLQIKQVKNYGGKKHQKQRTYNKPNIHILIIIPFNYLVKHLLWEKGVG